MLSTLNRYIAGRILRGIAIAFLVVTTVIMLVDFVESSRNLDGDSEITALQLMYLTVLKTPKFVEQTIAFVVLFGVMGALHSMNKRSELIVVRAAGVSVWRFLQPALIVTALLGIIWMTAFNPFASRMLALQQTQTTQWLSGQSNNQVKDIWLREGTDISQTVIHASQLELQDKRLINPVFYQLSVISDGSTKFTRRFDASSATLVTQGYWQLEDVVENAPGELKQNHQTISLPTKITVEDLQAEASIIAEPAFWDIPQAIKDNEQAGFSTRALRMKLNRLLSLPVILIAMTFIAASASLNLAREGGTIKLLVTGAALGFAVYFIDSMISAFGQVSTLPVHLASWSVPIFALLTGISYLSKIEDG